MGIRDEADLRLALAHPTHGLGILAELVQHQAQQVAAGVLDIRILRAVSDEVAKGRLGFSIQAFAVQQEGTEVARLVVAGMPGQARRDGLPGLVQPALLLKPHRQTDTRVHGSGVRGHRALESGAGIVQLPEALVLPAKRYQQIRVVWGEFQNALVGLVREREIQFARRCVTQLEPQFRHGGVLAHQIAIGRQG